MELVSGEEFVKVFVSSEESATPEKALFPSAAGHCLLMRKEEE
jgi:hypothetical protein